MALSLCGDVLFERPGALDYPMLTAHDAKVPYETCPASTGTVIGTDFLDRWTEYEQTLWRILHQKYTTGIYAARCRPLWLVLSLGFGFELMPGLRSLTLLIANEVGTGGFDRVIVQLPREEPIELEADSAAPYV